MKSKAFVLVYNKVKKGTEPSCKLHIRLIKNSIIVGGSERVDLWSQSSAEHAKACRASHSLQ